MLGGGEPFAGIRRDLREGKDEVIVIGRVQLGWLGIFRIMIVLGNALGNES